jgi:hypothetical protein
LSEPRIIKEKLSLGRLKTGSKKTDYPNLNP